MRKFLPSAFLALAATLPAFGAEIYECPAKLDATLTEKAPEKLAEKWKPVGGGERPLSGVLHEAILTHRGVQGANLRCTYKGLRLSLVTEISRDCSTKPVGAWKNVAGTPKDATCSGAAKCVVECTAAAAKK